MKTKHFLRIALACWALLAAGCEPKALGRSDISAGSGGRDIHVVADGGAWVAPAKDKFTVKLAGHELVIGKEQLLVDKAERAKVPAGAKKFEVAFEAGTLTVSGDGVEILKTPLGKCAIRNQARLRLRLSPFWHWRYASA